MNIHFNDHELFSALEKNTISSFKIGSHLYGLNNDTSDLDILHIYLEPQKNRNSFVWEHHQLQYKSNDTDYIFTTLQSFIRNLLTGDSTINFEILYSDYIQYTPLSWLGEIRDDFRNYNIIKSYLGMAKRDYKAWVKATNNGNKHSVETNKQLSHFIRGVIFAKNLLDNKFSLDLNNSKTFKETNYNDFELVHRIKNGCLDYSFSSLLLFFLQLMDNTRSELNKLLDDRKIYKVMSPDKLKLLDEKIINVSDSVNLNNIPLNYNTLFFEVIENGLNYN